MFKYKLIGIKCLLYYIYIYILYLYVFYVLHAYVLCVYVCVLYKHVCMYIRAYAVYYAHALCMYVCIDFVQLNYLFELKFEWMCIYACMMYLCVLNVSGSLMSVSSSAELL